MNGETVKLFISDERAQASSAGQKVDCHRIPDELLDRVAHGAGAKLRVKSFANQKGQDGGLNRQCVSPASQETDFPRKKFLRDFQLVFVAEPMKHELLGDARKDLWGGR